MSDPRAFLGTGWGFPIRVGPDGAPHTATHDEAVAQSIRLILATDPGERVMRPDFGAGLGTFVFEPINTATLIRIRNRVQQALVDAEARIDVLAVTVTPDRELPLIAIDVQYRIRATNSLHNLVYPFYLDEGTAP
ncbi:baseplate protein [Actinoplanes lobatus]|uniref:Baseplate protein n=1 Tax=Actinoplanes lobatus TaxID=113568 RepID=A0A7W7MKI6_9ACTN|nr:GPW/gp25 family protein [Actinoplanes lobatus]MBB4753120.1 phage baseplate assembly protein W [Actinoplanes lobatus]GGN58772.1 baseplate protein [Actinoplanes lobatus]GIE43020.1 baseplate protein [Actinoplanes lobatus]